MLGAFIYEKAQLEQHRFKVSFLAGAGMGAFFYLRDMRCDRPAGFKEPLQHGIWFYGLDLLRRVFRAPCSRRGETGAPEDFSRNRVRRPILRHVDDRPAAYQKEFKKRPGFSPIPQPAYFPSIMRISCGTRESRIVFQCLCRWQFRFLDRPVLPRFL